MQIQVKTERYDVEFQKFRVNSGELDRFKEKCFQAEVKMTDAIRQFMRDVGDGKIELKKE